MCGYLQLSFSRIVCFKTTHYRQTTFLNMALLGVYYEMSHDSLVGLRGSGVNFKRTDVGMRGNRGKGFILGDTAYCKTWPGPIGLAWPQIWPGLNFGLYFGLASKIGLASNVASTIFFGLIFSEL